MKFEGAGEEGAVVAEGAKIETDDVGVKVEAHATGDGEVEMVQVVPKGEDAAGDAEAGAEG